MVRILREIDDHLERADARIERLEAIEAITKAREDRSRRVKVAVTIFALICAAYAIANSIVRDLRDRFGPSSYFGSLGPTGS